MDNYTLRIPVEIVGQSELRSLYDSVRGVSGATQNLSKDLNAFAREVREGVNEGKSLNKSLQDIRTGATDASDSMRSLASRLQEYIARTREAEAQTNRFQAALAKIGGRIGGQMTGIPGGGFMGGQLLGSLGLTGGAAIGVGAGAAAALGTFELIKHVDELGKWAQAQEVASKAIGVTVVQQEQLTRISERTGVNLTGAAKAAANLAEEFQKGGTKAREIQTALSELNLPLSTIFKNPADMLSDLAKASLKIDELGGDGANKLSALGDSFREVSAAAGELAAKDAMKNIISKDQMDDLAKVPGAFKDINDQIDRLITKSANPIVFTLTAVGNMIEFMDKGSTSGPMGKAASDSLFWFLTGSPSPEALGGTMDAIGGVTNQLALKSPGAPGVPSGLAPEDFKRQKRASDSAYANENPIGSTDANAQYEAQETKITADFEQLKIKLGHGEITRQQFDTGRNQLEGQWNAAEVAKKRAAERTLQMQALQDYDIKPTETPQELGKALAGLQPDQFGKLPKQFNLVSGTPEMADLQARMRGQIIERSAWPGAHILQGTAGLGMTPNVAGLAEENQKMLDAGHDKNVKDEEEITNRRYREQEQALRGRMEITKSQADIGVSQAQLTSARTSGALRLQGISGDISSPELAWREYQNQYKMIHSEGAAKVAGLTADIENLKNQQSSDPLNPRFKDWGAELQKKEQDRDAQKIETATKSVDALNKFNEAVTESAQKMKEDLAGSITSIAMGAQEHGTRGARQAALAMGEGWESTVMKNILTSTLGNPFAGMLGKVGQGTPFGPQRTTEKETVEIKDNSDKTALNTTATVASTVKLGELNDTCLRLVGPGSGGTATGSTGLALSNVSGGGVTLIDYSGNQGSIPPISGTSLINPTVSDANAMAAPISMALAGGSAVSIMSAALKAMTTVSGSVSGGITMLKSGDAAGIFSGYGPTTTNAAGGTESIGYTPGERIAGAAGLAGMGVGVAEGLMTASQGGARNILGGSGGAIAGIGGILSAVGAVGSTLGAVIPGIGAAMSLVSAFLPDPHTQRANQIQNAMFMDQYLAPQAQNISVGGNGGYTDVGAGGTIRTSNLSPYPVISQSYLDIRTRNPNQGLIVPGHQLSSFGGYQNVTGAKTFSAPPMTIPQTQSAPTQTIQTHVSIDGTTVATAFHTAISNGTHPVVNELGKQLGIR